MIFREVEDRDLVQKAAKGNVDAFNLLVSRHEKRVFNYLYRLVGHREDALDITQDVFLKAYQNLTKLSDVERFSPWLFRIAHNEAYSLLRRNRPDNAELVYDPPTGNSRGGMYPIETTIAVERAMSRLTADQREAVVLKIFQGFKFEEMAAILDLPLSTIKSRLYSALDMLKGVLAPVRG